MNSALERRHLVSELARARYGASPEVWCRAPGRVDLMGSHTDYNLGRVLTLPIGCDVWIGASARPDRRVRLYSCNLETEDSFSLDQPEAGPQAPWGRYVRGVARVLQSRGFLLRGFDGVMHSTVPIGGGLSSSAALECAVTTVFEVLGGWNLDPVEKARLCQRAENEFVGVNCGILDQYTSCAGQHGCALLLDCRDLTSRPVKLADDLQVVVCHTNYRRELKGSEYGQRRAQCEEGARLLGVASLREVGLQRFERAQSGLPATVARRCRFVIEENDRVPQMAAALADGDRAAIRRLSADSFRGACELYEISVPAMQAMMEAMLAAPGVLGARQAGAGFGGCMVAFVAKPRTRDFIESVRQDYFRRTHLEPGLLPVAAAAGAGRLNEGEHPAP
jgi:galactokinase